MSAGCVLHVSEDAATDTLAISVEDAEAKLATAIDAASTKTSPPSSDAVTMSDVEEAQALSRLSRAAHEHTHGHGQTHSRTHTQ